MPVSVVVALCAASFLLAIFLAAPRRGRTRRDADDGRDVGGGTGRARELEQPTSPPREVEHLLRQVSERISSLERERTRSSSELVGQVQLLQRETGNLTRALRQPHGRGRWGELQLRRVVELAGLTEHCRDFTTQHSAITDEQRRLRPDMIVNLPNGRCVVIDAKTPLDAYLDAVQAADDEAAQPHLQRHAEQVRTHVRQLAAKEYAAHIDGAIADLVVLFLPAEHLFAAAVRERADLIEEAWARGVVIASPSTLLTLLHAVSQGWREQRLADGAEQIAQLGRELHERIATMADHFSTVGARLDSAMEAYNRTVGALERRVLPAARKFEQLDAAGARTSIDQLTQRDGVARPLTAPELLDSLDGEADVA
ncbi:MAG: DNA recombination protein RmuC [Gaiellales bacterium]